MRIEGRSVVVTGAGGGLGAATANRFARLGAKVAILDLNIDLARKTAAEIGAIAIETDVSDAQSVDDALEQATAAHGAPSVAVNCAGVGMAARIVGKEGKTSFDVFERVLRVNLFGTYNVMTHAARRMMAQDPDENGERGVVINTASIAYEDGQLGQ